MCVSQGWGEGKAAHTKRQMGKPDSTRKRAAAAHTIPPPNTHTQAGSTYPPSKFIHQSLLPSFSLYLARRHVEAALAAVARVQLGARVGGQFLVRQHGEEVVVGAGEVGGGDLMWLFWWGGGL